MRKEDLEIVCHKQNGYFSFNPNSALDDISKPLLLN